MDKAQASPRSPPNSPQHSPRACGVISPSPTSSSQSPPLSPTATPSPSIRPTNLDELLDDCFQISIGQQHLICQSRLKYATSFDKYLTSLHCHENLAFLMEIFKYEYFYDKIFPENILQARTRLGSALNSTATSSSVLNSSLPSAIDLLPFPTKDMRRKSRRSSRGDSRSRASSVSESPSEPNVFDFGFEENFAHENVWDKLKDQHVDSSDSELESDSDSEVDNNALLLDQWAYIMATFVYEDSPQQLNLANATVKELLDKDAQDTIHKPAVLIDAKQEIIQLLRENVYGSFLSQHKSRSDSRTTSAAGSASVSRAHSRPQSPPSEDASFVCSASNCCQLSGTRLFSAGSSAAVSLSHTPVNTPGPKGNSKCHSPSPLHHPLALKKTISPGSPLVEPRNSVSDLHHEVVSPVPVVKRKTPKFFPHIGSSTPSDSSGSDFSLSSIISHFKSTDPGTPKNSRSITTSHPQTPSALSSGLTSPVLSESDHLRPSSTSEGAAPSSSHSHRLGKLWRRRK
ncbi:hypothetical protein FT663_03126 [Candidozyma haemuli var. vulneris]|uniref:RGS domain-containing protein n=1 Tax=Candidozyma haemuli TaxID=45357 RepID=A0A2V1AX24_9ASCO|nr:hypothetical protein CXQ85_005201 [[Candida] haemuloni]KAF3987103.1 hypothetical protein FT662_04175 [[Candida] haemuloni var. vulneris]KAF3990567.1 hypothetical protein FT663_03126 [[Candida] haemuloni var. vulneris]PVH22627.1 hypothetical protein CXQ85_005201 [[Candida] haemuloni]